MKAVAALSLAAIALAALSSCAQERPAGLSDADRAANEQLAREFAERVLAKDWEGVASLYAEDAVLLPPNAPAVEGRAAIKAFFEGFPTVAALRPVIATMDGRGDVAHAWGRYEMTLEIPGLEFPIQETGKFLDVRRKQSDGTWVFTLDMFNSDLPAAAPVSMEAPER